MIELDKSFYGCVRELFKPMKWNLVTRSVIEGNTIGRIFVDVVYEPRLSLLWNTMDTVVINQTNEAHHADLIVKLIKDEVIPDARKRFIPELNIYCGSDSFKSLLLKDLKSLSPVEKKRNYYRYRETELENVSKKTVPITGDLLKEIQLSNYDQLMGWIFSFWPGIDDFLKEGFGYCTLVDEAIASWCLTVYSSGNERELGLATVPKYRNMGFAAAAGTECLHHCRREGIIPHWQCDTENKGSVALAEKLGFEKSFNYYVIHLDI